MNRVLITGGTGLIGRALAGDLAKAGYEVIALSRNPSKVSQLPQGVRVEQWDGRTAAGWGALVEGAAAIVNLAGESIGIPPLPWTAERKRRIRDSRVNAGRAVVEAVQAAKNKPRAVIQSSAVGYYGLHGDEIITEESAPGDDFLAQVSKEWEASTDQVEAMGVRRAIIRTGVVLSREGGVLQFLSLPFRFFVGGPLGSGKQWMSWVHEADEIGAIRFLIETESARGAFNLSAPQPLTNSEFSRVLARVMNRPAFFRVPGFVMKAALGELAELLLLGGQRVMPARLQAAGYAFRFPEAEAALRDLLR